MKENLAALLKVKSLFSITCMAIVIASLFLPVEPWVQDIVKVIVVFYFGSQVQKNEQAMNERGSDGGTRKTD